MRSQMQEIVDALVTAEQAAVDVRLPTRTSQVCFAGRHAECPGANKLADVEFRCPCRCHAQDLLEGILLAWEFARDREEQPDDRRSYSRADGDLASTSGVRWTHLLDPGGAHLESNGEDPEFLAAWLCRIYGRRP